MLQIIAAVLGEPAETAPTMSLLLANQTEDDILVRDMLEGLKATPRRASRTLTPRSRLVRASFAPHSRLVRASFAPCSPSSALHSHRPSTRSGCTSGTL